MPGCEWVVDARGCDPAALTDLGRLRALFEHLVSELGLRPVGETAWHQFPAPGGITGLCLLAESHLACHTFPEYGSLCLNVFCCRPRPESDFRTHLVREFGAAEVRVRTLERRYDERCCELPELWGSGPISLV